MMIRIGDLMYEQENLINTVRHCKLYNSMIRDIPEQQLVEMFLERVKALASGFESDHLVQHVGSMHPAFNSFFVIDPAAPGNYPTQPGVEAGSHVVNFFVRLGRKPALRVAE